MTRILEKEEHRTEEFWWGKGQGKILNKGGLKGTHGQDWHGHYFICRRKGPLFPALLVGPMGAASSHSPAWLSFQWGALRTEPMFILPDTHTDLINNNCTLFSTALYINTSDTVSVHADCLKTLLKCSSVSEGLEWSLRVWISNQLPGDASHADLTITSTLLLTDFQNGPIGLDNKPMENEGTYFCLYIASKGTTVHGS